MPGYFLAALGVASNCAGVYASLFCGVGSRVAKLATLLSAVPNRPVPRLGVQGLIGIFPPPREGGALGPLPDFPALPLMAQI